MNFEDEIRERLRSAALYDGQPLLLAEGETGCLVGTYDAAGMRLHVRWLSYRGEVDRALERLGLCAS